MTPMSLPPTPRQCPACGATIRRGTTSCWLCHYQFPPELTSTSITQQTGIKAAPDDDYIDISLPEARGDNPVLIVFGVLTVVALTFPLIAMASEGNLNVGGVIIGIVIVGLLPFIRTAALVSRRHKQGVPITPGLWIAALLGSIGAFALISIAAGAAFFAACFVVCLAGSNKYGIPGAAAVVVASIAALAVVIPLMIRFFRPRR